MQLTPAQALMVLAKTTTIRPFSTDDWCAYSGCTSPEPMIGEYGNYVIIIDGDCLSIIDEYNNSDEVYFTLGEGQRTS